MCPDLPDYTRTITVNIDLAENLRVFATKAETVTKKLAHAEHGDGVCDVELCAAAGYKAGLLMIIATTESGTAILKLQSWLGDTGVDLIDGLQFTSYQPLILTFPCWIPEQDAGDGVTNNIVLYIYGPGCGVDVSLTAIWFEEEA